MIETYKHPGGKLRRLGPHECTEKELLAILINTGTSKYNCEEIAEKILDKFDGLLNIMGHAIGDLMEIEGVGIVKATQIAAVFELTRRIIRRLETL